MTRSAAACKGRDFTQAPAGLRIIGTSPFPLPAASFSYPRSRSQAMLSGTRPLTREAGATREPFPRGRLVSLWDMLRFDAYHFLAMMGALHDTESLVLSAVDVKWRADNPHVLLDPATVRTHAASATDTAIELMSTALTSLAESCEGLELSVSGSSVHRILRAIGNANPNTIDNEVPVLVRELRHTIQDELNGRVFLSIPPSRARYLDVTTPPFGDAVQAAFPALNADISEASLCMGCGRWTAAVFHLMRVAEGGLRRFARVVRIKIGRNPNWGGIINDIDAKLKKWKPQTRKGRKRHDTYSELAALYSHIKNGWRNTAMHLDNNYSEERAVVIYQNVRLIMTSIAAL